MLRVGLTGDLGSGKSTVARLLAERGALVLSSDEIARALMEPGQPVYRAIVERFGRPVVDAAGHLDRAELARLAFDPAQPRVEELNALVHPAVLAEQEKQIRALAEEHPDAIVVVESALIFSVKSARASVEAFTYGSPPAEPWRSRFDCVVVVSAPRALKMERFLSRTTSPEGVPADERARKREDAARRLDLQAGILIPEGDSVLPISNAGTLEELAVQVDTLLVELQRRL